MSAIQHIFKFNLAHVKCDQKTILQNVYKKSYSDYIQLLSWNTLFFEFIIWGDLAEYISIFS